MKILAMIAVTTALGPFLAFLIVVCTGVSDRATVSVILAVSVLVVAVLSPKIIPHIMAPDA